MNRENIPDDELIRRRSDRLSTLLRELNPSAEQVSRSAQSMRPEVERAAARARFFHMRPAMKAAAIIVLLLATAFAVPPVRAWMAERAAAVALALGLRASAPPLSPAPAPVTQPTAQAEADVAYNFTIQRDTLELFIHVQQGELLMRRENRELASAQVTGIRGEIVILGNRLRIAALELNADKPDEVRYELILPVHVRTVRLQKVEGGFRHYDLPATGMDLRVRLAEQR